LINGYSRTVDGLRAFGRFEAAVKQASTTQAFNAQRCFTKEEIEFEVVDSFTVDRYLYEMNSGFSSRDSEKLFDHLDMIFIDGDATILPWFPKARKFLIMLRMCKKTGKVLFACSFAMQMFVFLCATNIYINQIVNGAGRGSNVAGFRKVSKGTLARLDYGDLFLDSATGDIYGYDMTKKEFYPIANAALHNHKAAQEDCECYLDRGKNAMLKSYRYIPQNFDDANRILVTLNESSCRIMKQYIQHWLSERLGVMARQYREFVVPCPNAWDVHPVNSTDAENIYQIFAESPRAPMIIMHKNAVCTQFHVDPKYPETVHLLENFVKHMSEAMYSEKVRMDVPLNTVLFGSYQQASVKEQVSAVNVAAIGHRSIAHTAAKHSGYAFSKRGGPVLVMNNATTYTTVKAAPANHDSSSSDESSYSFTLGGHKHSPQRKPKHQRANLVQRVATLKGTETSPVPSKTDWAGTTWSRQDIREFLHPGYPLDSMPKRPQTRATSPTFSGGKTPVRLIYTPFSYCRYKQFPLTQTSQTLRSADTPYTETARVQLLEARKSKEKWVHNQGFRTVFRAGSTTDLRTLQGKANHTRTRSELLIKG